MELIIVFLVGLASGFLGATVGSGGMISIPALLFLGLPPQVVIGTNKVGDVGTFAVAIKEYLKAGKINKRMALVLTCLAAVGSLIGTQIMIQLDTLFLTRIIGIVILLFLPFLFVVKNMGIKRRKAPAWKMYIGLFFYFLVSVMSAIAGAGGATVMLFLIIYFLGFEIIRGYATNTIAVFSLSIIPAVIYFIYGFVNVPFAIILLIGGSIGGYIGSKTALKKGNKWVRNLFAVVVIISVVKILFV